MIRFVPSASETAGPVVLSTKVTKESIFRATNARITDHSRHHDFEWKRVFLEAPSYFPTFATEEGHCE